MIHMLKSAQGSLCTRQCAVLLFSLWTCGLFPSAAGVASPPTNATASLTSLDDVWKKWDNVPIESVRRAANAGDTTAMVSLGHAYRVGDRVGRDSQEAIRWFRLALDRGDPRGALSLGWIYGYGEPSIRDEAAAVTYYLKAAEQGEIDAMYELYLCHWDGKGVAESRDDAFKWLTKAAESGSAVAQCQLGIRLERPSNYDVVPVIFKPNNMPEAIRWYRKAMAQDFAGGYCRLGLCYLEGKGVVQDEERGVELIRKAADQGQQYSLVKLAELYDEGIGEPRSEADRPLSLLLRAAEDNSPDPLPGLIFHYQQGLGTARDLVAASRWYCRAAMAHNRRYSLPDAATQRQEEKTPPADPFRATLSVYLKAATRPNDSDAPLRLAEMYLVGRDAPRDATSARIWLELAVRRGAQEARGKLSALEASMSAEELQKANGLRSKLEKELAAVAAFRGATGQDRE
jgi:TPR repeat protein